MKEAVIGGSWQLPSRHPELHQMRKKPQFAGSKWQVRDSFLAREHRHVIPSDARCTRQQEWLSWLAEQQLAAAVRIGLPTTTCNRRQRHPPRGRPDEVFGNFQYSTPLLLSTEKDKADPLNLITVDR